MLGRYIILVSLFCVELSLACSDRNPRCAEWTKKGECTKNPAFMNLKCRESCKLCVCADKNPRCAEWTGKGECNKNLAYMTPNCPKSCGLCGGGEGTKPKPNPEPTEEKEKVTTKPTTVVKECRDRNPMCEDWSKTGECEKNAEYMTVNCSKSCDTCDEGGGGGGKVTITTTKPITKECRDRNPMCVDWSKKGECTKNAEYMTVNCSKSCDTCDGGEGGVGGGKVTTKPTIITGGGAKAAVDRDSCGSVRGIPASVRSRFRIPSFHQKYTEAYGIPVVSSNAVSSKGLTRACYITRFLFADRRDVRAGYLRFRGYVGVIGAREGVLSLPEYAFLRSSGFDWNARARGLGATKAVPISSVGEENALCYGQGRDRYYQQDIGIHEFSHGLHLLGAVTAIRGFDSRLQGLYRSAVGRGLWRSTYAGSNYKEYWAEGVSHYFNVNRCSHSRVPDGIHNHICSRSALQSYDPNLYNLVREVFPCNNPLIDRCKDQSKILTQRLKTQVNGKCVYM